MNFGLINDWVAFPFNAAGFVLFKAVQGVYWVVGYPFGLRVPNTNAALGMAVRGAPPPAGLFNPGWIWTTLSLLRDALLVLYHSWAIPLIFFPPVDFGTDITWYGLLYQFLTTVISIVITASVIAAPALIPAVLVSLWILRGVFGVYRLIIAGIRWFFTGSAERRSGGGPAPGVPVPFASEAWLCVNGVATTTSGLQLILDELHNLFQRPVKGVLNESFGLWFDLVECVIQRDLVWPTLDVHLGYRILREKLRDPAILRVVLIAHSQGGIIASAWLDRLLADTGMGQLLAKLEIYTFASAANHFSSHPAVHLEHFANGSDFVSRIGVLSYSANYGGTLFVRPQASGHLLLSHYLAPGQSILAHPAVFGGPNASRLVTYLGGNNPMPAPPGPPVPTPQPLALRLWQGVEHLGGLLCDTIPLPHGSPVLGGYIKQGGFNTLRLMLYLIGV